MDENVVEDVADMFQALAEDPRSNEPGDGDYTIFVGNPKHHDGTRGSFVLIDKEMGDSRMLSSIEIAPEDIIASNLGKIVTVTDSRARLHVRLAERQGASREQPHVFQGRHRARFRRGCRHVLCGQRLRVR